MCKYSVLASIISKDQDMKVIRLCYCFFIGSVIRGFYPKKKTTTIGSSHEYLKTFTVLPFVFTKMYIIYVSQLLSGKLKLKSREKGRDLTQSYD